MQHPAIVDLIKLGRRTYREYIAELHACLSDLPEQPVLKMQRLLEAAYREKQQVFIAGNGGSAATASHMATDFAKTLRGYPPSATRPGLRAIALTDNIGLITAWANDEGYDRIFSEQLQRLATPGDLLIVISGSGNSPNVIRAVEVAQRLDLLTVGLLGKGGGALKDMVDVPVIAPSDDYGIVEDVHMTLGHLVTRHLRIALEEDLLGPEEDNTGDETTAISNTAEPLSRKERNTRVARPILPRFGG